MKQFTEPEVEINAFVVEDVITASGVPELNPDDGSSSETNPDTGVFS